MTCTQTMVRASHCVGFTLPGLVGSGVGVGVRVRYRVRLKVYDTVRIACPPL